MKYDYANIIGRFQLPHNPHFDLINKGLDIAEKVNICLGSANIRRNLRNPFTVEQRMALIGAGSEKINQAIRDHRINFVPLEDSVYSDQWWIEHVQRQVGKAIYQSEARETFERTKSTIPLLRDLNKLN